MNYIKKSEAKAIVEEIKKLISLLSTHSEKKGSFDTEEFYKAALKKTYGKGGEK